MIEWLFTFLIFYLLYKLIFGFILPVAKASAQVKNNVNRMNGNQQQQPFNQTKKTASRPPSSDYIDFEEVKPK